MTNYEKRYEGFKFKAEKPILDIGGGDGSFLRWLKVKEATIVDVINFGNNEFNFIQADLKYGLKLGNKYKTIFIMETLEHLENPLYLMKDVYDLLDKEGVCYVSVPYTEFEDKYSKGDGDLGHVSRWTKKEITEQMQKLGFKVKVIQQRRRLMDLAFWRPHCWLVLELRK